MANTDEWYWEIGDKFTFKSAEEPKQVYEVTGLKGSKYVDFEDPDNQYGTAPYAAVTGIDPWVSPKLRKFVTLKAPWTPDPEDELLDRIAALYREASSDSIDNEVTTSNESEVTGKVLRFIAEGKSRDPIALAKEILRVHELPFKRY